MPVLFESRDRNDDRHVLAQGLDLGPREIVSCMMGISVARLPHGLGTLQTASLANECSPKLALRNWWKRETKGFASSRIPNRRRASRRVLARRQLDVFGG